MSIRIILGSPNDVSILCKYVNGELKNGDICLEFDGNSDLLTYNGEIIDINYQITEHVSSILGLTVDEILESPNVIHIGKTIKEHIKEYLYDKDWCKVAISMMDDDKDYIVVGLDEDDVSFVHDYGISEGYEMAYIRVGNGNDGLSSDLYVTLLSYRP